MLKVNEYFDGKVKSIAFQAPEGPATVGVISKGTYEFATRTYEYMTVVSGSLEALFEGDEEWMQFLEMDTFEIEPDTKFTVRAEADVAYTCLYTEEPLEDFLADDADDEDEEDEDEDEEDDSDCGCRSGNDCCCK